MPWACIRAGERPMADIDLLVRPADAQRAAESAGSARATRKPRRPGNTRFSSLHSRDMPRSGSRSAAGGRARGLSGQGRVCIPASRKDATDRDAITGVVFPLASQARDSIPIPRRNALLLHLLLHAAGNMCGRRIAAHASARHCAARRKGDARGLGRDSRALRPRPQALWWALPPLELLNRYQPGAGTGRQCWRRCVPACPWALRRLCRRANLAQMSYASLAISAFPGAGLVHLAARTAALCAAAHPPGSPNSSAARRVNAAEQWAVQKSWPTCRRGAAYSIGLFGRPPRQASMYIVQAVLENPLQT